MVSHFLIESQQSLSQVCQGTAFLIFFFRIVVDTGYVHKLYCIMKVYQGPSTEINGTLHEQTGLFLYEKKRKNVSS